MAHTSRKEAAQHETRYWIAVASAEHVRRGRAEGFMQVCHGKLAPLARVQPGDGVIYYSPSESFRGTDRLQSFTAIGRVFPGTAYQADMGGGFHPHRRDVDWFEATEVPIKPLLGALSFTAQNRNWGYQLRFGLFEIEKGDFELIRTAMLSGDLHHAA